MKLRITVLENDGNAQVTEALVINGGAELLAGTLREVGTSLEVEVAVPQAVVLREEWVTPAG